MALDFTERWKSVPLFFTQEGVMNMIQACQGDGTLPDPLIEEEAEAAQIVCQMLHRSAEIEVAKHMAVEEIKDIADAINAPGLIPEPEPTIEPLDESGGLQEAPTAQGTPLQDAYNASIAAQQANGEAVQTKLKQPNSQELGIVEAAKEARLDNAYGALREVFDMDDQMLSVRVKDGAIVTPADLGKLAGFGFDLGKRAVWLLAESFNRLMVLGHEASVIQIASEFGFSGSYTYNLIRAAQRVPETLRAGVLPTVCVELANARYSKDDKENLAVVEEMVQQAREEKWSCAEARSQKQAKLGREEPIEGKETLREKVMRLEAALGDILKIELRGDSGPFTEIENAQFIARKALNIPIADLDTAPTEFQITGVPAS